MSLPVVLEGLRQPLLNEFFISLTVLGSFVFGTIVCLGMVWLEREQGLRAAAAFFVSYAVTHVLKIIFQVPRPAVDSLVEVQTFSFPSGHATAAFSLAVILSDRNPGLRAYFLLLAFLVCFSRFYLGVHFVTDVIVGAFVGYSLTKLVLDLGKH